MKIDPKTITITLTGSYEELLEDAAAELEKNPQINRVDIADVGHALVRVGTPEEQATLDDNQSITMPVEINGAEYLTVVD